jgi:hypothetical protein
VRFLLTTVFSHSLPEYNDDEQEEFLAEDRQFIKDAQIPAELQQRTLPSTYGAHNVDYSMISLKWLVELREAHQTRHAAHAVRTRHSRSMGPESQSMDANNTDSVRQSIVKEFYSNLKSLQERGVTTGESRDKRWKNSSQAQIGQTRTTGATIKTTDVCFFLGNLVSTQLSGS